MALVIVHPHLEHVPLHPDLLEELPERRVVVPGDPPPAPLGERRHLLLLLRRELRPVPLPLRPRRRLRPRPARRRPEHRRKRMDRADRLLEEVVVVVPAVEVAVAPAGRALERLERAGLPARHELAAAVVRLATDRRRVVPHALTVAVAVGGRLSSSEWKKKQSHRKTDVVDFCRSAPSKRLAFMFGSSETLFSNPSKARIEIRICHLHVYHLHQLSEVVATRWT